jgi:epoxyqueuosine reductase
MEQLTRALHEQARIEGFDLIGVATAGPADTASALRHWVDAGMHSEMGYMAKTCSIRADPRLLLPNCKSVIAVGMSYRTSLPESRAFGEPDGRVWVSRYAWGRDYHRILKKRMVRLGRWLAARRPGSAWRACVDTAPVLEREWAARAGLGWIGKNTLLLNRKLGSEIFLGVVLTDLELLPDALTSDHCGKCTACLDACPTGALLEPRLLDARRCVGYLTVEHRSRIPDEFHAGIGSMVAGCDICQEVCPWTRRAPSDLHPEFAPAPHRFRPLLSDMEELDEERYRSWRRGSALNRISFPQMQRNLRVVRENLLNENNRPAGIT